jgi:hypothetical protein
VTMMGLTFKYLSNDELSTLEIALNKLPDNNIASWSASVGIDINIVRRAFFGLGITDAQYAVLIAVLAK